MKFLEYEKGGRTIRATETAYNVLYKQQGYRLKKSPPKEVAQNEGANGIIKNGGNTKDNEVITTAGKPKESKS